MSNRDTYDPIPAEVREAWATYLAVVVAHGFTSSSPLLHATVPLEYGQDLLLDGGIRSRYWPKCGAGGAMTVVSPQPPLTAADLRAAADALDAKGGAR